MRTVRKLKVFLIFCLCLVLIAGFIGCRRKKEARRELVICSYGGSFQEAQRKAYFEPFEQETGIHIKEASYSGEYGKIKAMVQTGNVIWDVVDVETAVLLRGTKENMFEPIDYNIIDKTKLIPEAVHSHGVATDFFSTILAYNEKAFPEEGPRPQSWTDFWDVQKFPGPRSLRRDPRSTLEIALMADGVPMKDLYPLDVDRALRSLERIREHIKVWWVTGNQPAQLLSDGEVVMASAWNGRIWTAVQFDNQPLHVEWNQGITDPEWWVIPRGANNKNAMEFIAFASQAKHQKVFTKYIAYGPTNRDIFKDIDLPTASDLPTYPTNFEKQIVIDGKWWAENEDAILEKWNAWLLE